MIEITTDRSCSDQNSECKTGHYRLTQNSMSGSSASTQGEAFLHLTSMRSVYNHSHTSAHTYNGIPPRLSHHRQKRELTIRTWSHSAIFSIHAFRNGAMIVCMLATRSSSLCLVAQFSNDPTVGSVAVNIAWTTHAFSFTLYGTLTRATLLALACFEVFSCQGIPTADNFLCSYDYRQTSRTFPIFNVFQIPRVSHLPKAIKQWPTVTLM